MRVRRFSHRSAPRNLRAVFRAYGGSVAEVFDLRSGREEARRTVLAVIAHDAKKDDLRRMVRTHRAVLSDLRLVATATTGAMLMDELQLPVDLVATGPTGGDLQIGARIVEGRVDAAIFLRDPLTAHPHEPDIQALLKVCDVHRIPVATNVASGEILIRFLGNQVRKVAMQR
jgi:methylglyoxal synthase